MAKKDDSLWNGSWRDKKVKKVIDIIPELKTDLKRLEGKKDFPSKQEVKVIKTTLEIYKTYLEEDLERFKGRTDEKSKHKAETIKRSLRFLTSETEKPAAKQKPTTYTVFDTRTGKTFKTKEEADAYEQDFRKRTGIFVSVEETHRKVTHIYGISKK